MHSTEVLCRLSLSDFEFLSFVNVPTCVRTHLYCVWRTLATTSISALPVPPPRITIPPRVLLLPAIALRSAGGGSVVLRLPQLTVLAHLVDRNVLVLASRPET